MPVALGVCPISAKKADVAALLNEESRAILDHPEIRKQIKQAIADIKVLWETKAPTLNLPQRGSTFDALMNWTRLEITGQPTGLDLTIKIPADFNAIGQPTKVTVIGGYTSDFDIIPAEDAITIVPAKVEDTIYR